MNGFTNSEDFDACGCAYGHICSDCSATYLRDLEYEKKLDEERDWIKRQSLKIDPNDTFFDQPVEPPKPIRNKKEEKIKKKEQRERIKEARVIMKHYPFANGVKTEHDLVTMWGLVELCRTNWDNVTTIMGLMRPPNQGNQFTFEDLKEAWHERVVKQVQEE